MRSFLCVALCLLTAVVHGQAIYQCKQQDGTPAFQDTPCPGASNAQPTTVARPNRGMTISGSAPTGGTALNQQQAKALIDQLLQARQFNAAMAVAKQNGLEGYLSQRDIEGPSRPLGPATPQGLPPEQRQQLIQALEALQTQMQSLPTKGGSLSAAAPQTGMPDAHKLPWALVFMANADGSLSPRGPIRYNGTSYNGPGVKFTHNVLFGGVDLTSVQGHDVLAHFDGRVLVIDKFL
jgi:hypothetical protein